MLNTVPRLTEFQAQCLMMDTYETVMGIFNHTPGPHKHSRPLAAIAMHPAENPMGIRSVNELIETYVQKDIHKYGVTLMEFLDLPHEHIVKLISVVDKKMAKESAQVDQIKNMMESAGKSVQ